MAVRISGTISIWASWNSDSDSDSRSAGGGGITCARATRRASSSWGGVHRTYYTLLFMLQYFKKLQPLVESIHPPKGSCNHDTMDYTIT